MGPNTLFEESTLQSVSLEETVRLEPCFLSNVTPLFSVETLADLEKAAAEGRTPEFWIFLAKHPGAATLAGGTVVLPAVAIQVRSASPPSQPHPLPLVDGSALPPPP